jgi:hypothetical protein
MLLIEKRKEEQMLRILRLTCCFWPTSPTYRGEYTNALSLGDKVTLIEYAIDRN